MSEGPRTFADGALFGHYEVIRRLGAGGMGEVYLARDTRLGRAVALHEFESAVLNFDRIWSPLRDDPRFKTVLTSVGLTP